MNFILREDTEDSERLLDAKHFNRHCAIYSLEYRNGNFLPTEYIQSTRKRILSLTKPNFLRGLGFGTILESRDYLPGIENLHEAIDTRQKEKSVWQWLIVKLENPRICIGIHTWMHVFLTKYYNHYLNEFRKEGYQVESFKKEKDKIMAFLSKFAPKGSMPEYDN